MTPGTVLRIATEVDEGTTIDIEYEFTVDGVVHRGKRLRFGGGPYYRKRTVDAIIARYPPGAAVTVHYNPSEPNDCTLETEFESLGWAPVVVFAFAILVPWTYELLARWWSH